MHLLALCAGGGGLEAGIKLVLADDQGSMDDIRTVCYVEGEAYAAAVLVSQMEKGRLHPAPVWSDLRTFDGKPWRGKVDLISAGFPCQPFSAAGKQLGTEDPRHLWPHVARIIGEVGPSIIILENVPGVIDHAGAIVAGDLAEMGFDSSWGIVRASDAAAPHRRSRWFCVAILSNANGSSKSDGSFNDGKGRIFREPMADTGRESSQIQASRGFSTESFLERARRQRQIGSKPWQVEPDVGRVVDGVAHWVDRLRLLGNGVVPQQAALGIALACEAFEMD